MLLALSLVASSSLSYSPTGVAMSVRPALRTTASPLYAARMNVEEEVEFPSMEELAAEAGMSEEEYMKQMGFEDAMDEDEYEQEQEQQLSAAAQKVVNNMRSSSGVEFAPWMKVDAEKIAQAKKEREERKARAAAQAGKADSMLIDPQAAELGAGGGLKSKVLSEEEIELRWSTQDEVNNAGFVVQRRRGGQPDFVDLASYESFAPLRTKGDVGGDYVYLDDTAGPGTWVYRIVDCDTKGTRSAVCQKLVEVDAESEKAQTLIVGGFIAGLAIVLVLAGILADPIQTTQNGAKIF